MSVPALIAHYLRTHKYSDTLKAFELEYGKPITSSLPNNETLEEIIYDRFEFLKLESELAELNHNESVFRPWSVPFPNSPCKLPISALVLGTCGIGSNLWLTTTDKRIILYDIDQEKTIKVYQQREIYKMVAAGKPGEVILVSMSGVITRCSSETLDPIATIKAHGRLIHELRILSDKEYIVTQSSVERSIKVYAYETFELVSLLQIHPSSGGQPSCIEIVPTSSGTLLVVGQEENTLLSIYNITSMTLLYKVLLNDAEFSSTLFTPRIIRYKLIASKHYLAVGTSHEPFMRLIVIEIPDITPPKPVLTAEHETLPPALKPCTILRNAIASNINTLSPQDKFLQPQLFWRKHGMGILIPGDDGCVRGIDLQRQEVVVTVKVNDGAFKSLALMNLNSEALVTCGIDKQVYLLIEKY